METFYKQRDPKTGGYKKVFYDRNEKSAFEFKEKREQKKAEKAYKIFELRIKGQISYELIDNILEVNGIQKWSKEAEKFMYELDGEMAMEVLKSGKEVKDEDLANKVTSILVDKFFEAKEEKPEAISETPTIETEITAPVAEAISETPTIETEITAPVAEAISETPTKGQLIEALKGTLEEARNLKDENQELKKRLFCTEEELRQINFKIDKELEDLGEKKPRDKKFIKNILKKGVIWTVIAAIIGGIGFFAGDKSADKKIEGLEEQKQNLVNKNENLEKQVEKVLPTKAEEKVLIKEEKRTDLPGVTKEYMANILGITAAKQAIKTVEIPEMEEITAKQTEEEKMREKSHIQQIFSQQIFSTAKRPEDIKVIIDEKGIMTSTIAESGAPAEEVGTETAVNMATETTMPAEEVGLKAPTMEEMRGMQPGAEAKIVAAEKEAIINAEVNEIGRNIEKNTINYEGDPAQFDGKNWEHYKDKSANDLYQWYQQYLTEGRRYSGPGIKDFMPWCNDSRDFVEAKTRIELAKKLFPELSDVRGNLKKPLELDAKGNPILLELNEIQKGKTIVKYMKDEYKIEKIEKAMEKQMEQAQKKIFKWPWQK